jgi:uncharacterized protein (UPF0332 family)
LHADFRHKGDYDDLFDFDKEVVMNLLGPVKKYINTIEEIVNQ